MRRRNRQDAKMLGKEGWPHGLPRERGAACLLYLIILASWRLGGFLTNALPVGAAQTTGNCWTPFPSALSGSPVEELRGIAAVPGGEAWAVGYSAPGPLDTQPKLTLA